MELRKFRMRGETDPDAFFAWCAEKGLSREDLMFILASVEPATAGRVNDFLSCYLSRAQVALLKEALSTGKPVHFYGGQGLGKSTLCNLFRRAGYPNITEAGAFEGTEQWDIFYGLPDSKDRKGLVMLEPRSEHTKKELSKMGEFFRKPFTKDEVIAWVLS